MFSEKMSNAFESFDIVLRGNYIFPDVSATFFEYSYPFPMGPVVAELGKKLIYFIKPDVKLEKLLLHFCIDQDNGIFARNFMLMTMSETQSDCMWSVICLSIYLFKHVPENEVSKRNTLNG